MISAAFTGTFKPNTANETSATNQLSFTLFISFSFALPALAFH
jgi:hypothetical protein